MFNYIFTTVIYILWQNNIKAVNSLDDSKFEKWIIETDDHLQPHIINIRILEDVRLEMQEAINSDLANYNFWEWKISNDESNYNFYHEL